MSDPIDILSKLFETLKDASNRNEQATDKLITQQLELVSHIKSMPVEELRFALTEHAKKSSKEMTDCNGTIELRSADIMDEVKKLGAKVTKMIIVVTVAFTVATSGYFLIRYAADSQNDNKWEERHEQIEKDQENAMNEKLEVFMNSIRKEMRQLHKEENGVEKP